MLRFNALLLALFFQAVIATAREHWETLLHEHRIRRGTYYRELAVAKAEARRQQQLAYQMAYLKAQQEYEWRQRILYTSVPSYTITVRYVWVEY